MSKPYATAFALSMINPVSTVVVETCNGVQGVDIDRRAWFNSPM
jgi:hypothetical protein